MEITTIGADLRLVFPIKWAERPVVRAAGESDEKWEARKDETELAPVVWAYHTTISRTVFEANYRAIATANMTIFSKGLGFAYNSGPVIATLALKDAARADALENGLSLTGEPTLPILAEITRLTLVLAPSAQGYEPVPVEVALARGTIDAEDWSEAQSSLVFFTCGLWMARRERRDLTRSALASVLRGSTTSSSVTEFAASLQPSTKAATSALPVASLVPS